VPLADAIWSSTDANVIYAHDFNSLWSYNVASRAYTRVANLAALLGGGHEVWQLSKSADYNVFAWTEEDASYVVAGYLVYKRSQNAIVYRVATTQLDEVQIDKSGRYLVVKTGLVIRRTDPREGRRPDVRHRRRPDNRSARLRVRAFGQRRRHVIGPTTGTTRSSSGHRGPHAYSPLLLRSD
jgi:hypothetical protein